MGEIYSFGGQNVIGNLGRLEGGEGETGRE